MVGGGKARPGRAGNGLNRSTVSRTLRRAQEVINSRIQYAVLALEWEKAEPNSFQVVSQASQVLAAAKHEGHTIGERIRRLRTRHALTKNSLPPPCLAMRRR